MRYNKNLILQKSFLFSHTFRFSISKYNLFFYITISRLNRLHILYYNFTFIQAVVILNEFGCKCIIHILESI